MYVIILLSTNGLLFMIQTFKAVIIPDKGNKLVGNLSKNSSKIYYTYDEAKNWAHCELNINFAAGKKCHGEIITQCADCLMTNTGEITSSVKQPFLKVPEGEFISTVAAPRPNRAMR